MSIAEDSTVIVLFAFGDALRERAMRRVPLRDCEPWRARHSYQSNLESRSSDASFSLLLIARICIKKAGEVSEVVAR